MAGVFKHRGAWYIQYKDEHGGRRRRATKARTKQEARRLAEDLERRAERQRLGFEPMPAEDGGETLGALLQWWLDTYSVHSPSHKGNVGAVRNHLIDSELAAFKVEQLTSPHRSPLLS